MTEQSRFIILGTGGTFTSSVLQTLLEQHFQPFAYIQSGALPQNNHNTFENIKLDIKKPRSRLFELLDTNDIPVYYQSNCNIAEITKRLKIDYLLVACWPSLLDNDILFSVSKAALNLHPSLLPAYRGVDPVGEQLSAKDHNFGISLHLLNNEFDAGDIVLQQPVQVEKVGHKADIEMATARIGAELFIRAVNTYKNPGWQLKKQNG